MELEKTLFRVHERILSSSITKYLLIILVSLFFVMAMFFFVIFINANLNYRDQSACLLHEYNGMKSQILNNTDIKFDEILIVKIVSLRPEFKNMIYSRSFFNLTEFLSSNTSHIDDALFAKNITNKTYSDPRNFSQFYQEKNSFVTIEIVQMPQLLAMPSDTKKNHDFLTHNILIDEDCYGSNIFFSEIIQRFIGLENILINEILYIFQNTNVVLRNLQTEEIWFWPKETIGSYGWKYNFLYEILVRILGCFEIILGLFLISNITAIYIKMTIICAPIFILILTECCIKFGINENISRLHVFKAFPWVGMYLYAMAYNNRRAEKSIYFAFICMIVLFYFVYLASSSLWSFFLFRKSIPNGLDENFYGFIACMEFLSILFIRTRSSFKFIPLFLSFVFFLFLYYVKFTLYGYYYLGMYFVLTLSLGYFGLNLLLFEIPALSWNPSFHYAPSIDKPRLLYFPLFSITSYYDLPHFWSMFYPLHDRSFFTTPQMSLIDRNFILLNTSLENARINNRQMNNIHEMNFDVEMQNLINPPVQPQNPIAENISTLNINLSSQILNAPDQNIFGNEIAEESNLENITNQNPVNQRIIDDNNKMSNQNYNILE